MFESGLMSAPEAVSGPNSRAADGWDRSLALFVDALNHFGRHRDLVVDRFAGADQELHVEWLAAGRAELDVNARSRGRMPEGYQLV
jgi:hypothetical protein